MSRQYADPIHVRSGAVEAPTPSNDQQHVPEQFLWRGRLYVVRGVIAHWFESVAWWGGSRRLLEGAIPPHEQEVWRVEAQPGRSSLPGVYDLCHDAATGQWMLARSMD
jgi:hypothetical protein